MRLNEQRDHYLAKSVWLESDLRHLLAYVNSSKFHDDKMVNSSDIILRIQEGLNEVNKQFPDPR
jgi:hypothetical protein